MSTPGARAGDAPGGDLLAQRYGAPGPWRRLAVRAGVVVVALVAGGWLAWTTLFHARPAVASELPSFEIVADDTAEATVLVQLRDDVEASCRVVARAEDHTTVGELAFTPVDGTNRVQIRTERRATSVELAGCTAPGQPRPR